MTSDEGTLDTLAPGESVATLDGPPIVRAGAREDLNLVAVDPAHYAVGKEIAKGGMGRILEARDRRLGRTVAIKELLVDSVDARARFEREARITARLQHPSIVSVLEAGTWPGGEPFYVMRLVAGQSLDAAIAGRGSLEARLGLLPHVIDAVEALAYAHSRWVIHRDLKPSNVLVGEFGETVVIDWGLAKDLSDASADVLDAGPYRTAAAAPGATVAGSVMGTPAYMAPEQAAGELVDPRADVYALGAMLYHLLAGRPPYRGGVDEILRDVLAGKAPPSLRSVTGVPAELVTIVDKAMAHRLADRYPTANELAADLTRFQTGQLVGTHRYSSWQLVRRWVRRHRGAVFVGAVAAAVLAVVAVISVRRIVREQAATERARAAAEESRGEAEDLLGFMLVDLRDKLKPLGRLDVLDDVATQAIAYYDRRGEPRDDAERAKRSLARRNVADVLLARGQTDRAVAEYRTALALAEQASRSGDPARSLDLAKAKERLGDALLARGERDEVLALFQEALAITTRLAAAVPDDVTFQRALSVSHDHMGRYHFDREDFPAALASYRAALAIDEAVVAADPGFVEGRRALSVSQERVADVLWQQDDAAGALVMYRKSLAIREELAAAAPDDVERQRDLWVVHWEIGDTLMVLREARAAVDEHRAALAIAERLAARDPSRADRQEDLATSQVKLGNALRNTGNDADALAQYEASLAIRAALVAKDPTNEARPWDVVDSQTRIADTKKALGDYAGAAAAHRAALAFDQKYAAEHPDDVAGRRDLASRQSMLGDVLLAGGQHAEALAAYRAALPIDEALASADPTNVGAAVDVTVDHLKIGHALRAGGDRIAARAAYTTARDLLRQLQAAHPDDEALPGRVAHVEQVLADCCGAGAR